MYDRLTDNQRDVVFNRTGLFVVRACPGSGKTFCVSARLARLVTGWKEGFQGVAAISFTNVAWQEIEKKYREEFQMNSSVNHPHFLGTIDSFINRYIFLPYGHLVLKCQNRPKMVGEPHGIWTGRFFAESFFDILSYDINGNMFALNPRGMPKNWEANDHIVNAKKKLNKAGYANQSDANFYAMKILEAYPQIAKAIALRFPFLIVDEAQDTSEIQMKIIDLLIDNGLSEVMMVGDPDQAIFEWNNARPDLLLSKYDKWPNSTILNESLRSSQRICNSTFKISSLPEASKAINGKVKDYEVQPNVLTYTSQTLQSVIKDFVKECVARGIPETVDNIAVLYRSSGMIHDITGIAEVPFNSNPWPQHGSYTKDVAKGKFLYDSGELKKGFKLIERALVKLTSEAQHCGEEEVNYLIEKMGFIKFRTAVYDFLQCLPETNIPIGNWVDQANANLTALNFEKQLAINNAAKNLEFKQLFVFDNTATANYNYRIGTVHSSKGETFEATLLILKQKGVGAAYKNLLNKNIPIADSEELRIAYVGITRPRKILTIAVPDQENKIAWEKKLFGGVK